MKHTHHISVNEVVEALLMLLALIFVIWLHFKVQ